MGLFSWNGKSKKSSDLHELQAMTFIATRLNPAISQTDAMKIPAVSASVDLISNSIAQLPIYLYKENEDGEVIKIADIRSDLFNHSSNLFDTGQVTKKQLVEDYLLYGRAYIYKNGNQIKVLRARNVVEEIFSQDYITVGKKEYVYSHWKSVTLDNSQVIEVDSGSHGVLINGENTLQAAIDMQAYSGALLGNSAMPNAVLKTAGRLTQPVIDKLRASFENLYSGTKKAGKTLILEEGMDYKAIQLNPNDMQLTDTQKYMTSEIAKLFNLPESMINSAANKYNSLEQNNLQFLTSCIGPILVSIESALDKRLLTNSEKDAGYYFRFDTTELLRTTEEEKVNIVASQFNNGLLSFTEARAKLDLPPSPQEDYFSLTIGKVLKFVDSGELVNLNTIGTNQEEGDDSLDESGDSKQSTTA